MFEAKIMMNSSETDFNSVLDGRIIYLIPAVPTACVYYWIRITIQSRIAQFVSKKVLKKDDDFSDQRKVRRIAETATDLIFHSYLLFVGILSVSTQPWYDDLAAMTDNHPHPVEEILLCFFNLYIAYYICELVAFFHKERKSDTMIYLIHHVVAIFTSSVSVLVGTHRVAAAIMYRYEYSDIFLLSAKIFRYLDMVLPLKALFFLFFLSWIFNRILWGGKVAVSLYLNFHLIPTYGHSLLTLAGYAFTLLQVLLLIWTWTICKFTLGAFRGHWDDIREN